MLLLASKRCRGHNCLLIPGASRWRAEANIVPAVATEALPGNLPPPTLPTPHVPLATAAGFVPVATGLRREASSPAHPPPPGCCFEDVAVEPRLASRLCVRWCCLEAIVGPPAVWYITKRRGGLQCVDAFGRRGVAKAPRFQLCASWAGPCRARGGCRAGLSVPGALLAQVAA